MQIGATTADLTELVARFQRAKQAAPRFTQELLDEAGEQIAARMRELAPVRSGALKGSIRVIREPGRVQIGPVGVEYASFVEYGTGIRGEFPTKVYEIRPKQGELLTFKVGGTWVSTRVVRHPGIRPHPYIRPAAAEVLEALQVKFAEAGRRAIA